MKDSAEIDGHVYRHAARRSEETPTSLANVGSL